jgi:hypothetical protein
MEPSDWRVGDVNLTQPYAAMCFLGIWTSSWTGQARTGQDRVVRAFESRIVSLAPHSCSSTN